MKYAMIVLVGVLIIVLGTVLLLYFGYTLWWGNDVQIGNVKDFLTLCISYLTFAATFSLSFATFNRNLVDKKLEREPGFKLLTVDTDDHPLADSKKIDLICNADGFTTDNQGQLEPLFITLRPDAKNKIKISSYRIDALHWEIEASEEPSAYFVFTPESKKYIKCNEWKVDLEIQFRLPEKPEFVDAYEKVAGQYPGSGYNWCKLLLIMTCKVKGALFEKHTKEFLITLTGKNDRLVWEKTTDDVF